MGEQKMNQRDIDKPEPEEKNWWFYQSDSSLQSDRTKWEIQISQINDCKVTKKLITKTIMYTIRNNCETLRKDDL